VKRLAYARLVPSACWRLSGGEPVGLVSDRRGATIEPLYAAAPATAKGNPAFYDLLTLVDALRVGRARERQRARVLLEARLMATESA